MSKQQLISLLLPRSWLPEEKSMATPNIPKYHPSKSDLGDDEWSNFERTETQNVHTETKCQTEKHDEQASDIDDDELYDFLEGVEPLDCQSPVAHFNEEFDFAYQPDDREIVFEDYSQNPVYKSIENTTVSQTNSSSTVDQTRHRDTRDYRSQTTGQERRPPQKRQSETTIDLKIIKREPYPSTPQIEKQMLQKMQKSICFEQEQHLLPQKRKPLATEPASRKRARNICIPQIETRRWHCNGRTKTYINHKRCDGDWTECPNKDCENFIMWDAKNNLKCQRCKSKGLEMKLSDKKSPNRRWRWVRCAAENCKAMYMHNRGSRLKRSADKCGLLTSAVKYESATL